MPQITLTRRFHAVGQGLFCSEHIYSDDNNVFNVIYDCGSELRKECRSRIHDLRTLMGDSMKIDFLFISHFHDDHISGLEELTKRFVVDKIVLPELSPLQKLRALILETGAGHTSTNLTNLRNQVFSKSLPANGYIEIPEFDSEPFLDDEQNEEPLSPELIKSLSTKLRRYYNRKIQTKKLFYNAVRNGGHNIEIIRYIPFYMESTKAKKFIKLLRNKYPIIYDAAQKENLKDLRAHFGQGIIFDELKDLYRSILGGHLNEYSMTVLSKPCKRGLSALYNGDYAYRYKTMADTLMAYYSPYWNDIDTIQAPHHGAERDNIESLYSKGGKNCVVSYGTSNGHKHPGREALKRIAQNSFNVYEITEKERSLDLPSKAVLLP